MDQLKPILENAYKYRFWIICGIVVVLSLGASFMAASAMRKETETRVSAINGAYSTASGVLGQQDPPNDASHKAMDGKITEVKAGVVAAWKYQYNYQNQGEHKLVWPPELGAEFIDQVTRLHPFEKIPYTTNPSEEALLSPLRLRYRNFIKRELPKLAEIIDSKWHPKNEFVEGEPANVKDEDEKKYLVDWVAANQTYLDERYDFKGAQVPTTLEVLYAQEDLWVIRTLLSVIKETNGTAKARYKAAIKRVDSILLGQDVTLIGDDASLTSAKIEAGSSGGGGGEMGGMDMGMGSMEGMEDMGSDQMDGGGGGGSGGEDSGAYGVTKEGNGTRDDPAHLRYVDNDFVGVPGKTVREALTSKSSDMALYKVAKRIPVRLQMSIDYRRLNKFLTLCGNAPLQIEIERVRINKKGAPQPTRGGGGGGGMGDGGGSDEGGYGSDGAGSYGGMDGMGGGSEMGGFGGGDEGGTDGMMGGFGGAGGTTKVEKLSDESPFDVDVEIFGMVYMYNPVDEKLEINEAPVEQGAVDGDVPPADGADPNNVAPNANGANNGNDPNAAAPPANGQPAQNGQPPVDGAPAASPPPANAQPANGQPAAAAPPVDNAKPPANGQQQPVPPANPAGAGDPANAGPPPTDNGNAGNNQNVGAAVPPAN